jgi:ribosomal protein L11 methyltransferase
VSWLRICYRSKRDLGGRIGDVLEACGAIAVSTKNAGADEFFDAAFPKNPEWNEVYVSALFARGVDPERITESVVQQIGDSETQPFQIDELPEQDWMQTWSRSCRPIRITDHLWVCPSSIESPVPDAVNIVIDPGLAFGTGTHPTTRLCLEWLANADLSGKHVVDYGCGSGILAIAAVKLGAVHAWAFDIDSHALTATRYNARRNHVDSGITVVVSDDTKVERADIVIANILANVIISFEATLTALVRPRGTILLTGILDSQVERVCRAFRGKFEFERHRRQDWSLLVGRSTER